MHRKFIDAAAHDSDGLATEKQNPASQNLDQMSGLEIVTLMNYEDATIAGAVQAELPKIAAAVEIIVARLQQGGRLIYMGAGTSGRLGVLDASECPPTFNTPSEMVVGLIAGGNVALTTSVEEAEDSPQMGREDAQAAEVSSKDVVVGIAASGRTPYVLGALAYAKEQGAFTVGLTCNKGTPLDSAAEIVISPEVGPEVLSGSTRLKSGTAQKMVLNMLSTATMVKLGKVYGNLMVDVRISNAKLRRRAVRILQTCTDLDEVSAAKLLDSCNGETKVAIVAALLALEPIAAREKLEKAGGFVRLALTEP
jgi:N-acetylmuramic acid 6-phosphate etherase